MKVSELSIIKKISKYFFLIIGVKKVLNKSQNPEAIKEKLTDLTP